MARQLDAASLLTNARIRRWSRVSPSCSSAQAIREYIDRPAPDGARGLASRACAIRRWRRALDIIHNRYAEELDVENLAREVGVSRSVLGERFAELIGEPPSVTARAGGCGSPQSCCAKAIGTLRRTSLTRSASIRRRPSIARSSANLASRRRLGGARPRRSKWRGWKSRVKLAARWWQASGIDGRRSPAACQCCFISRAGPAGRRCACSQTARRWASGVQRQRVEAGPRAGTASGSEKPRLGSTAAGGAARAWKPKVSTATRVLDGARSAWLTAGRAGGVLRPNAQRTALRQPVLVAIATLRCCSQARRCWVNRCEPGT